MKDLSTDELAELRESFDSCDSNGDGWIIVGEFSSLLNRLDQDLSDDECLLAFEMTDGDGDGKISFERIHGLVDRRVARTNVKPFTRRFVTGCSS
jgi:Ca2+-binding EF-hand superfamily protein